MIEELIKDPEIQNYLHIFPKDHWNKCIYLTLLYGIRSIKRETSYSKLSFLENLVLHRDTGKSVKKNRAVEIPSAKTPREDRPSTQAAPRIKEKRVETRRVNSPPQEKKHYKMPRYLKNVESKIKSDVQKDLAIHRYEKEAVNSPTYRKRCNRSLPELLDIKEPNTCPIDRIDRNDGDRLVKLAEKFLKNPYTKILSPR